MIDFAPSPLNEEFFAGQISIDGVGVEGQRKFFNSRVVLLGLSEVGTFVVRGLLFCRCWKDTMLLITAL